MDNRREFLIFGNRIKEYSTTNIWDKILDDICSEKNVGIIAINPEKITYANNNPEFKEILREFDYPIIDGSGVALIIWMKYRVRVKRLTGIDLMEFLIDRSRDASLPLFFYGSKPGVAEKAVEKLSELYPGINVAGIINGYEPDEDMVVALINESKAKIVFVALGSPLQEKFIHQYLNQFNGCILQGVGGSFDVFAGNIRRAPKCFRVLGLEWLYRLIKEPRRIIRQLSLMRFFCKAVFTGRG